MRAAATLFFWLVITSNGMATGDTARLYRATAVVTGQGEENRQLGFKLCMEDVIARVSGDYRLVTSGKARTAIDSAAGFVTSFSYRDRLEGVPIHDEQGTHDRPHDLTVDFDPTKVDAALAAMGSRAWLSQRPRLAIFLGVSNAASRFVLAADGEQGSYMRDSFTAASDKIAVPISFVPSVVINNAGLVQEDIGTLDLAVLDRLAKDAGVDQALAGTLTWSDAELGWIAEWRLAFAGRTYAWRIKGVSFDDAFRSALRGAAQVLSGNGEPSG